MGHVTVHRDFIETFHATLSEAGLHHALAVLNGTAPYRFTGVYRFEPDWVRSVCLFDRENPELEVGGDVPMEESYCMYTGRGGEPVIIENAPADGRWVGHAAVDSVLSYVAVLLEDPAGAALGTLCHFDFCSRKLPPGCLELLSAVREPVQSYLRARGVVLHPATRFGP